MLTNDDVNKKLGILTVLILLTVFVAYSRSFKDDVPTCDGYVLNVYLYITLGLLIMIFAVHVIAKRSFPITRTKALLSMGIALIAILVLFMIRADNVLLNHLVWVVFLLAISVSVYFIWRYTQYKGILESTLAMVFCIFVGLSLMVYFKPDWVQLSWGPALTWALFIGLLAWVIPMFFTNVNETSKYHRLLSGIFVFVFCLFILYDTKLLQEKAKSCVYPDYPKDSLGLILNIVNLFSNIALVR